MARNVRLSLILVAALMAMSIANRAEAQSAWGGGCTQPDTSNTACIALVWPTLYGDFYLFDWTGVDPDGYANVWFCFPGQTFCYSQGGANTDHLGQYAGFDMDVPFCDGWGVTFVQFFDAEDNWLSDLVSPPQYWAC